MSRFPRGPFDRLGAALVVCALLVVFFWSAIARFGEAYYSSADISRASSFTRVGDADAPSNQLLSDPVVQMEPWVRLAREDLAAGRLPLWNPWNAGGMPLFANLQSALLSPFTLPHYVMPERAALLVAAFAKLFCAAFGTFLLLRKLGLESAAALLGGVVYAFSGHNVLLLAYPHSGVSALLPVALLCVEVVRERFVARGGFARDVVVRLALLSVVVAACVFAGHPEAALFALGCLALFATWRSFGLGRRNSARLFAAFALSVLAGIALAAVQLVPFVEYVGQSSVWAGHGNGSMPIWSSIWALLFFPDLAGNPSTSYRIAENLPPPNYETANLVYVGSLALFLALAGAATWRRRPAVRFFVLVFVAWVLYAYDIGLGRTMARLPLLSGLPPNRSQLVGQMMIGALSAFALDEVLATPRSWRRALALLAGGLGLFTAFAIETRSVYAWLLNERASAAAMIREHAPAHVAFVVVTFVLGSSALVVCAASASRARRTACAAVVVLVAFTQTGWLWRAYNPLCENAYFHPRTSALDAVARFAGDDPFVVVGAETIPPCENALQHLRMVAGYDALWIARYDRLACAAFGDESNWRLTRRAEEADLVRFGARFVLARTHWPPIGTFLGELPAPAMAQDKEASYETAEIVPGREVEQTLSVDLDSIDALACRFRAGDARKHCRVRIEVLDVEAGRRLASDAFEARDLLEDGASALRITRFVPPAEARGRTLRVRISSPDGRSNEAVALRARRDMARWIDDAFRRRGQRAAPTLAGDPPTPGSASWRLAQGGQPLEGALDIDVSSSFSKLEPVCEIAGFHGFELARSSGRFRCVARAIAADGEDDAARRALDRTVDPRDVVVLEGQDARSIAARSADGPLTWNIARVAETPTRIELDVRCSRAACLVSSLAWYPGWRVEVDGLPQELVRADSAFASVAVPAGSCRIVLRYAPASVLWGAAISAAVLMALAAFVALARREP